MDIDSISSIPSRIAAKLLRRGSHQTQAAAPADGADAVQVDAQPDALQPDALQPDARQARLQTLRAMAARDAEQELEMLSLTLRLEPATDLRPALAAFNAAHPGNAGGLYLSGVAHLKQDDAGGLALLDRAMELAPEAIPAACEHAHNFLMAQGETALADRYALRARLHAAFDDEPPD
jgi:hypothetical protein